MPVTGEVEPGFRSSRSLYYMENWKQDAIKGARSRIKEKKWLSNLNEYK